MHLRLDLHLLTFDTDQPNRPDMMKFYTHMMRGILPALLMISLQTIGQTISSDVGTTICKGQTVIMTTDGYYEWEVSTDNGSSWTSLGYANSPYKYSSSSIGNGYKYRVKSMVYDEFGPPSYNYSEVLTFTVNGQQAGMNNITDPSRGSISFNGSNQGLQMSSGFSVETGAFTFETWFRLTEVPWDQNYFVLLGADPNDAVNQRALSIVIPDPNTIRYDSWRYGPANFTVPKLSVNTWYHLIMVRDASMNLTVYLNGSRSTTGIFNNTSLMTNNIGITRSVGVNPHGKRFSGLLTNVRMVVGSALYDPTQSSITVPTAPLSSVTNTKLLLLANSAATVATDASGTQTLSANGTAPGWVANSPFRETISASRTISNSVTGGTWSSSNTAVATVNASGVITPVANGDANITYTITSGGCTSTDVTAVTVALPCVTNTWSGGTGNWSVAGNWSCGSVPDGSTNIAITSGTPTLDANFTIPSGKSLSISGTGNLIIAAGKTLTIAGTADFGGRPVTLRSTASGDAAIGQLTGTLSNATQVTVERYIGTNKRAWRLLSIPVSGSRTLREQWAGVAANAAAPTGESAGSGTLLTGHFMANGTSATAAGFDWYTGLTATSTSSIRFYSHNGTSGTFSSAGNTPAVNAVPSKQGYMLFVRGDRTVTTGSGTTTLKPMGTLASGTQNINIAQAYEVVGNPYAATIDADLVYQNSGNNAVINRNFWVWDATLGTAGGYRAISYSGSVYNVSGGGTATDYLKIRSGQAFFVEKNGGGSLTIQESNKTDGSTAAVVLGAGSTTASHPLMNITLTDGTGKMTDGITLRFGAGYKHAPDEVYDMPKMNNFNENLSLVTAGRYLSIESRPLPVSTDTALLAVWNLSAGLHKLIINTSDLSLASLTPALRDAYTGITLPIPGGQAVEHPFEINADTASRSLNRFRIVFSPVAIHPVEVLGISATRRATGIAVSWKVSQPTRLLYSELQGSRDGTNFRPLSTITGSMSEPDGSYTWLDRNPAVGINRYRVRTLSIDGTNRFSQPVTAEWRSGTAVRMLSNPSSDGRIRLILTNLPEGRYQLAVRKLNGAMIHQQYLDLSGSVATPEIDLDRSSRALSTGVYLITIDNGKGMKQTAKWIYKP